jgi:hypothetical protein
VRSSARISAAFSDVSDLFSSDDVAWGDSRGSEIELVAGIPVPMTVNGG